MIKRENPTDSVNIWLKDIRGIDLRELKPLDWVEGIGTLTPDVACALNKIGECGYRLQERGTVSIVQY